MVDFQEKAVEKFSVPTDDRRARRIGFMILLVTFAGFGGWAAVAELDSAAVAAGVVTVESYRKTIQHLEGGIVKDILVRDGDRVRNGAILLRLEDTQARARLEIIRSQYLAARALETRLIAERDQQTKLAFPEELLSLRQDSRVRETLDGQERAFKTRRDALQGETALLEQRIEQLHAQIGGLEALQQTEQKRLDSLRRELQDFRRLQQSGYTDKLRLLELERDIAKLEGEQAGHLADLAKTRMQVGETKLQILQLHKQLQTDVVAELRDTQTKLFDLIERMRALQDTVERTEIRAPTDGTVVGLNVHTIGGVVATGTPLLEIVPQGEQLLVEAKVQPTDIDKVHPGLEADIRFTAFKLRTTPVVEGKILTVSADRLIDSDTKYPYYLARIQVTAQGMERLKELALLPGMPAEVIIKTGERSLLNYFVRPLLDAFARSFRED